MDHFEQPAGAETSKDEAQEMERELAETKESLPPLKADHVRVVHLTRRGMADRILAEGLDYSKQGMLSSTARSWSDADLAEFSSDDPRFQGDDMVAVVMDIPFDEAKLHDNIQKSPGSVPSKYVVGVIPSRLN